MKNILGTTLLIAFFSANNLIIQAATCKNYKETKVEKTYCCATANTELSGNIYCFDSILDAVDLLGIRKNFRSAEILSIDIKVIQETSAIHQSVKATAQSLKLVVSNELGSDETIVRFGIGATRGFDSQWDIYKLGANICVPTLCSETEGAEYAINSLPVIEDGTTVDVNLEVSSNGTYTLSIKELMNFEDYSAINLYDKLTKTSQNLLLNGIYTFKSTTEADKHRFVINFQHALITNTNFGDENCAVNISSNTNNKVTIRAPHTLSGVANVEVINMLGEVVCKLYSVDVSTGFADININNAIPSIYIVKASIDGRTYSKEVYLGK